MRAAIVIPALNEARTIGAVIESLPQTINGTDDIHIIVVDDGSTDCTSEVAEQAGADLIVQHEKNLGVGAAVKTGIDEALRVKPDVICLMDADGQFEPSELDKITAPIMDGDAEVVIGSRFHDDGKENRVPIVRMVFNKIVATLVSILISHSITDAECGFRAMSAKAARDLDLLGRFTFTHDMLIDLAMKHFKIVEVPVSVKYFRNRESRAVRNLLVYGIGVIGMIMAKMILSTRN